MKKRQMCKIYIYRRVDKQLDRQKIVRYQQINKEKNIN